MRRVGIIGLGRSIPKKILTNADLEKMVDTSDEWITTRTGIKERHLVSKKQAASDLAAHAAKEALAQAKIKPENLDLIINRRHLFETFDHVLCSALERGASHLSQQHHFIVVLYPEGQIVKDAVVGKCHQCTVDPLCKPR